MHCLRADAEREIAEAGISTRHRRACWANKVPQMDSTVFKRRIFRREMETRLSPPGTGVGGGQGVMSRFMVPFYALL